ncbi:MAG: glutathione S-transferase [Myxococcota bacterium]
MITVHHLEHSRSHRILWLLEELGVDYEIEKYARDPQTNLAPPSLRAVFPLGKSPVVTDGELTFAESGAIVEYLIDTYGEGRFSFSKGSPEYHRSRYWLHAAEGSVMSLLLLKLVFTRTTRAPVPFFLRPITKAVAKKVFKGYVDPGIQGHTELILSELERSAFIAGDELCGADFLMIYAAEALVARGTFDGDISKLKAYVERIHARPAYARALERGGPCEIPG